MSSTTLPTAALQFDFENITGNTLTNSTDSAYNGTINGATTGSDNEKGGYLEFGYSDSVSIPVLPGTGNYDFSNGITITAWVNLGKAKNMIFDPIRLMGAQGSAITMQYLNSTFGIWGNATSIWSSGQPMNQWVYVAITYNSSNQGEIYIDTGSELTSAASGTGTITLADIGKGASMIGNYGGVQSNFKGKIAWISVYNEVLNETQIKADMALKKPNSQPSTLPAAALQFDFENITGNTLPNLTGSQYNGTISGATPGSDSEMGSYLKFNGTELVSLPDLPGTGNFDFTQGISFCAWVNLADNTDSYDYIVNFDTSNKQNNLGLQSAKDNQYFFFGSDCWLSGQKNQPNNQWIFVAGTLDPSENACLYVYANGVLNKTTGSGNASPSFSSVYNTMGQGGNVIGGMGAPGSVTGITGKIAWLSVYNKALTETQIKAEMKLKTESLPSQTPQHQQQANLPPAALQFDFENITGTTLPDLTGSQYNGNIQSGCTPGIDPVYGAYLSFNGSDSVKIPDLPGTGNYDFSKSITIAAWVNLEKNKAQNDVIFQLDDGAGNTIDLQYVASNFYGLQGSGASAWDLHSQNSNEWIYVAGTLDGTSGDSVLYIKSGEGGLIIHNASGTSKLSSNMGSGSNLIGQGSGSESNITGKIAWLSVYNQVLTSDQILEDMAIKGGVQLPKASLQFDFKGITGTTLPNLTDSTYNGTIGSGVTKYTDPEFGDCLSFISSGSVTIPSLSGAGIDDLSNGITATCWIYMATDSAQSNMLTLETSAGIINFSMAYSNIAGWLLSTGSDIAIPQNDKYLNQWIYVSMSMDGSDNGEINVYANGTWTQKKGLLSIGSLSGLGTHLINIGDPGNGDIGFKGNLAWLSVYNCVLSKEYLKEDMMLGKLQANTAYRKTLPLDFSLTSDDKGHNPPVLFIEKQGLGKKMNLAITNTASGSASISIPKGTTAVSANYYQFQLRFKPGTLSSHFLNQSQAGQGYWKEGDWHIGVYTDAKTGEACVNFVNTGSPITLGANSVTNISLGQVNANPLGGARNTSVMFQYDDLKMGTNPISGHRRQSLSIISHLGQKDIPLNVSTIGAPRILNNNKPSYLQIRIENTTAHTSIPLTSVAEQAKAKFEVGFLVQPHGKLAQWALAKETGNMAKLHWPIVGMVKTTATNATSIALEAPLTQAINMPATITITPPVGTAVTATLSGNAAVSDISLLVDSVSVEQGSVITLVNNSDLWNQQDSSSIPKGGASYFSWEVDYQGTGALAPGDSIDFLISDITCDMPPGQAFISLKYYNLGGYWDGEFLIPIEKTPISIGQQTIGIGLEPDAFAGNCSMQIPYGTGFPGVGLLLGGDGEDQGIWKTMGSNGAIVFSNLGSESTALHIYQEQKDKSVSPSFALWGNGSMSVGTDMSSRVNPGIFIAENCFTSGINLGDFGNITEEDKVIKGNYAMVVGDNWLGGMLYIAGGGSSPAMTIDSSDLTTIKHLEISSGTEQLEHVPLHVKSIMFPGIPRSSATLFKGTSTDRDSTGYPLSISCAGGIYARGFLIPSDERIKTVKGLSDSNENLNILNQLKVRDYQYRDKANKGNATHTGAIAQELAEVMPEAVSLQTDFIPDIYAHSIQVVFDATEERLTIHLEKAHGLSEGDKVKLIPESGTYEKTVIEVLSDTAFKVGEWETETSEVFVYGCEVNDFHTVNYDAITMLGVSATQQLSKEVDALKEENQTLKAANEALQQKLDTEIAALKASIAKMSTK